MNGKSYLLEQPLAHAVPPMQATNMSKITMMEMKRSFNLSIVSMWTTASRSFPSPHEARSLIDKMQPLLADSGLDIRKWASNNQAVIHYLPPAARSKTSELWFSENGDHKKLTLGLQ